MLGLCGSVWAFSSCRQLGLLFVAAQASHCGGFCCYKARTLKHRLGSYGTWVQLPCGMWNLPGTGINPVSPAVADSLLATGPPVKSKPSAIFANQMH